MRQVIAFRTKIAVDLPDSLGTGTVYHLVGPTHRLQGWSGTEADRQCKWRLAGTFSNLFVRFPTAPGSAKSRTVVLRVNGSDSALTVTASGTSTTLVSDIANTVTISSGDTVSFKEVGSGGPADSDAIISCVFESTVSTKTAYGFVMPDLGSLVDFNPFGSFTGAALVMPMAGTIDLTLDLSVAPGGAASRTFRWIKNTVLQNGSGGTTDTTLTISGASTSGTQTASLSFAAGDTLIMTTLTSGGPAGAQSSGTVIVTAATKGYGMLLSGGMTPSTSTTQYLANQTYGSSNSLSATETDYDLLWPDDICAVNRMYVLGGVIGTYTFRVNSASPASGPAVVHTSTSSVHSDTAHTVTPSAGNTWDIQQVPTGSGGALQLQWSVAFVDTSVVPVVETKPASAVKQSTARINGSITPNGNTMDGRFKWGTDSTLVTGTETSPISIGNGSIAVRYAEDLIGLDPNVTYYFRAIGNDGVTDILGTILSFTTHIEPFFTDGVASHPVAMVQFIDAAGDSHLFAEVDLNDEPDYEGGYKEPRIMGLDLITGGLSDRLGQCEHSACRITFADSDRFFRGLLDDPSRKFLVNRPLIIKLIDDEDRRLEKPWRVVFNGYVSEYAILPNFQFSLSGTDWLKRKFSRQRRGQFAWQPRITLTDFPQAQDELTKANGDIVKVDAVDKVIAPIYGAITTYSGTGVDNGKALYRPILVGVYNVGGDDYYKWVVAAGACQSIDQVDVFGVAITLSSTDWLIPGQASWTSAFGSDDFEDINARRWTTIYGLVGATGPDQAAGVVDNTDHPADAVPIALAVSGIEDVGDCTGNLIVRLALQAKHFAMNFLANPDPDFGATGWLTVSPTFEILSGITLVDEDSFDAVDLATEDRIPTDGYQGAGAPGANNESVGAEDVMARFCVSGDFQYFFNRKGQMTLSIEPVAAPDEPLVLDDILSVTDGSFRVTDKGDLFFNTLPYLHTKDYSGRSPDGWWSVSQGDKEITDTISVASYDQAIAAANLELHFGWSFSVEGAATIADVVPRHLRRYRQPYREVVATAPFSAVAIDPGDVWAVSAVDGIGSNGWTEHLTRATRRGEDIQKGQITITGYDIEQVWSGPIVNLPGGDVVLVFREPGTFVLPITVDVQYLVVAGGGAGGQGYGGTTGGGGAGGVLSGTDSALAAGSYAIAVGAGGVGGLGSDSSFNGHTAVGGGIGGADGNGAAGGSGGGGSNTGTGGAGTGGQGNTGGNGSNSGDPYGSGGGGGAGAVGANAADGDSGGAGGVGVVSSITDVATYYGGGGGGNGRLSFGVGGNGGGGHGGAGGNPGTPGAPNTGGGGGGGGYNGGSGIVILRYTRP